MKFCRECEKLKPDRLMESARLCATCAEAGKDGKAFEELEASLVEKAEAGDASAARAVVSLYGQRGEDAPAEIKSKLDSGELETVDLKGVELMVADVKAFGTGSKPGGDLYTRDDLARIAVSSNAVLDEARPANKIGHSPEQRLARASGLTEGEMPALGWLNNFHVEGDKLKADVRRVPKKFASMLKSGAFRTRSVEVGPFKSQTDGTVHDTVVRGLAWLGAKAPAFRTLDDVYAMYAGDAKVTPTAALLYEDEESDAALHTLDFAAEEWVLAPSDPENKNGAVRVRLATPATDLDTSADTTVQMADSTTVVAKDEAKVEVSEETLTALYDSLGLTDDERDPAKLADAVTELKERADKPADKPEDLPAGTKLMTEDEYAEMRLMAEDGKAAREQLRITEREVVLLEAQRKGKFDPAKIEDWRARYDAAPEMTRDVLAEIPASEDLKTYGADGGSDPDLSAMDEKSYQEFCNLTGIPYVADAVSA